MDFIVDIPENLGEELRLMQGTAKAELVDINPGESSKGKPKLTLGFVLLEDITGYEEPTTGAKVLDTCSLQPQALFGVNNYYKQVAGEKLPTGKMSGEDFMDLMSSTLVGTKWVLKLEIDTYEGESRTRIKKAVLSN